MCKSFTFLDCPPLCVCLALVTSFISPRVTQNASFLISADDCIINTTKSKSSKSPRRMEVRQACCTHHSHSPWQRPSAFTWGTWHVCVHGMRNQCPWICCILWHHWSEHPITQVLKFSSMDPSDARSSCNIVSVNLQLHCQRSSCMCTITGQPITDMKYGCQINPIYLHIFLPAIMKTR